MVKNIENSPKDKCLFLIHIPFGLLLCFMLHWINHGGKTILFGNTVKF